MGTMGTQVVLCSCLHFFSHETFVLYSIDHSCNVVTRPKRLLSNLTSGRQGCFGMLELVSHFRRQCFLRSLESRVEIMVMHQGGAGPPQAWAGVIAKRFRMRCALLSVFVVVGDMTQIPRYS